MKRQYVGPSGHPDASLQQFLFQKDERHAGRTPCSTGNGFTARDLLNHFLAAKQHQFEMIGDVSKDQDAVDHVMACCRDDMASVYRERIRDARLQAVVNRVRARLGLNNEKSAEED